MAEEGAVIKHDIEKAPKTGEWGIESPIVDKEKCISCGACVSFCPEAAIEFSGAEKKVAEVDYEFCKGCGACSQICPVKAIKMVSRI